MKTLPDVNLLSGFYMLLWDQEFQAKIVSLMGKLWDFAGI